MLTPFKFNQYNPQIFHSNNHQINTLLITRDVQNDAASASHPSMLRLTRFNLNHHKQSRQTIIKHRPNSVLQIIKPVFLTSSMADSTEKTETQTPPPTTKVAEDKEGKPGKVLQKPTPPEKPEAGDCCGSGCVRCVWDIYYDDLDSYNQLLHEYNSAKHS